MLYLLQQDGYSRTVKSSSGNQQYNVREKPTVILYTYINRHAGTPDKNKKQNRNNVVHHQHGSNNILFHRL